MMGDSQLSISPQDLDQLIGGAGCPVILDVRRRPAFEAAERVLPTAVWCPHDQVESAGLPDDGSVVVYCVHGHEVSRSAAALLRAGGHRASYLDGGIDGYMDAGGATIRKPEQQTQRWVMPARPSALDLAAAWLLRRFVCRDAKFLFVEPALISEVARETGAGFLGETDLPALIDHHGLEQAALRHLTRAMGGGVATELSFPAVIAGLSHIHGDDRTLLAAALPLFDGLFAWCRQETMDG